MLDLQQLTSVGHQLYQCQTLESLFNTALRLAADVLQSSRCCFVLVTGEIYPSVDPPPLNPTMIKRASDQKKVLLVVAEAIVDHEIHQTITSLNLRLPTTICIPLIVRENVIGVFYIESHLLDDDLLQWMKWFAGQIAVFADLCQTKLQLEAENRRLTHVHDLYQFLREVVHKLKTSLTVIQTSLSIISRLSGTSIFSRHIGQAKLGVQTIVKLLDTAMLLVKLDVAPSAHHPVNLEHVLKNALASIEPLAKQRHISLNTTSITPDLQIDGDENELQILMEELVKNACHFSQEHCQITIGLYRRDSDIVFEVSDTGIGIEDKTVIFKRLFATVDATGHLGFGLGLPIVHRIAERHHATVEVETGKGSTFRVIFSTLASQGIRVDNSQNIA